MITCKEGTVPAWWEYKGSRCPWQTCALGKGTKKHVCDEHTAASDSMLIHAFKKKLKKKVILCTMWSCGQVRALASGEEGGFCPHLSLGFEMLMQVITCIHKLQLWRQHGPWIDHTNVCVCVCAWWEWWGRLALARSWEKKRGVERVGELERPNERECITFDVSVECSASREEKQQQSPRDGVMAKTRGTWAGEQRSLVWLRRSLCGRCGEWEMWPRAQQENPEWQVVFGLFSVGNSEKS